MHTWLQSGLFFIFFSALNSCSSLCFCYINRCDMSEAMSQDNILKVYVKPRSYAQADRQLWIWHDSVSLLSFLASSFLGFSQTRHRSERWTMQLFSGRVGGRHSEREKEREMGFESRWWKVGKVLVTVSLEDPETRYRQSRSQVQVGRCDALLSISECLCKLDKCSRQFSGCISTRSVYHLH